MRWEFEKRRAKGGGLQIVMRKDLQSCVLSALSAGGDLGPCAVCVVWSREWERRAWIERVLRRTWIERRLEVKEEGIVVAVVARGESFGRFSGPTSHCCPIRPGWFEYSARVTSLSAILGQVLQTGMQGVQATREEEDRHVAEQREKGKKRKWDERAKSGIPSPQALEKQKRREERDAIWAQRNSIREKRKERSYHSPL